MLRRWIALRADERALLAGGVLWVMTAQAVLRVPLTSFINKQRALDAVARGLPRLHARTPSRAVWAVTAAARRVPGTKCLPWALALRGLLLQAGIASELRIGVAPDGDAIKAHAWVECDGTVFSWNEPVAGYSVLGSHVEQVKRAQAPRSG
jgi:hypothetical protein